MIGPFIVLLVVIHGSSGSHFRGGSMSWKPISGNTVQVEYSVSFKASHKHKKFETCTSDALQSGSVRDSGGKLTSKCDGCLEQEEKKLYYVCTDLDTANDWFIGKYAIEYTVPAGQTRLLIGYENCCWIPVVSPQRSDGVAIKDGWNLVTEVNIEPRPDGSINSSPVTNPIPLEKYHKACSYDLRVTVSDSDNDMIKCRNQTLDECNSNPKQRRACGKPTDGLTVNPDCTLKFNANEAGVGDHAVNIMIEDCPDDDCTSPYSKVPLLFLLNVAGEGDVCMKPTINVPPACRTIPPGEPVENLVIEAEAADVSKPISHFSTTQQPDGMSVSALQPVTGSATKKQITISWTPRSDQIGQHSVCFSALDDAGFTSGRVCTFIRVSQTPPLRIDPVQSTPARGAELQITEGQEWTVRFNAEIQRPNNKANIRIRDDEGYIVYSVNVLSERRVTYSGNTLSFTPKDVFPFFFSPTKHTIEIDEGVALPSTGDACASGAAEWPVLLTNKVGEANLAGDGCKEDNGPVNPNDKHRCPLFVKELERDENYNMVETGYHLCCTCHDLKRYGPPGRAPGAGPPGNEGYGIVV